MKYSHQFDTVRLCEHCFDSIIHAQVVQDFHCQIDVFVIT